MYWISLCSASWAELSFQVRKMMQNCLSQYAYALSIFPFFPNAKNYTLFYRASPAVWGSINVPGSRGSWGHQDQNKRIMHIFTDWFCHSTNCQSFFLHVYEYLGHSFFMSKKVKKRQDLIWCVSQWTLLSSGPPFSLCQQRKKPNTICSWTKVWVITFVISNYGVWVETFLVGTKTLIFVPAALGCYLASIP